MTTMLTPHISLEELIESQTASRRGIDNIPNQEILQNLIKTAEMLEVVRSLLGSLPIIISSGYRCPELNSAIGGSKNSAHMYGKAVDFICPSYGPPIQICKTIELSGMMFDQLIHEFNSWVHIAWDDNMRQQILTINNYGTRLGL